MKMSYDKSTVPLSNQLNSAPFGELLADAVTGSTVIKLKPVKSLLRSDLISDVVNRGDCLVMMVATGTLTVLPGERVVDTLDAEIKVHGIKKS